jgi:hypothetical protein
MRVEGAQIGIDDLLVGPMLVHRSIRDQPARGHDKDPTAQVLDKSHIVLDQ